MAQNPKQPSAPAKPPQEVAKRDLNVPVGTPRSVEELFVQYQKAFSVVAAKGMDLNRMMRVAVMAMSRSQQLLECTAISLVGAFMEAAQLGLDLAMKEAHLVPFKNKWTNRKEVQLVPDYRGLLKLARNTGQIKDVYARLVYKGERFKVREGNNPHLEHEPNYDVDHSWVNIVAAYTIATWDDGRMTFEVITKEKIERARSSSATGRTKEGATGPGHDSPWGTDYDEMAMKTAIKHRCKTLPRSPQLQAAIDLDDRAELGRPQNIEIFTAGDKAMAQIGPDNNAGDGPGDSGAGGSGEGSRVLLSETECGKIITWKKRFKWPELQFRGLIAQKCPYIPQADLQKLDDIALVHSIGDKEFETIVNLLEIGPEEFAKAQGGGGPAPEQKQPEEKPEPLLTDDERDNLWAYATETPARKAEFNKLLKDFGFKTSKEITKKAEEPFYAALKKVTQ